MHIFNGLFTPPPSPLHGQPQAFRCPPPPESRIGLFLGRSLELKGILGTGAYGVVYSALDHLSQAWYAVKALSKTNAHGEPLDKRQREFQAREIQLHYAASAHPNIVSMLKIVDDPDCTYVVLEYCPEGDLFSNITEGGRYVGNDALTRQAFLQVLNAVEHCHRLGIYHRDLKPENILVSHSGTQLLLADFGLATTDAYSADHGCGSTFYMSPECLDHSSDKVAYRCAPNDVWSLGVILVNLTCGRNPWKQASVEDPTYRAFTWNPDFLRTILPLSGELSEILGLVFQRNPAQRITVSELKRRITQCSSFSTQPAPSCPATACSPAHSPEDESSAMCFPPVVGPCSQVSCPAVPAHPDEEANQFPPGGESIMSDEGSLTGSCSTLSDSDSDFEWPPGSECGLDSQLPARVDSGYAELPEVLHQTLGESKPPALHAITEATSRSSPRPCGQVPSVQQPYITPPPVPAKSGRGSRPNKYAKPKPRTRSIKHKEVGAVRSLDSDMVRPQRLDPYGDFFSRNFPTNRPWTPCAG
ncbi:hypothetical protein B2J93_2960 [Marssonina coronariae]|uniref:Autophagy-related protein 1 n=1 Tax=Diplocarpon coronariae TaxID=2795749 RepID=A0A218Z5F7_9HELO|nr:hypothetical protein B2J93_2960 [Marssonina coronariae]